MAKENDAKKATLPSSIRLPKELKDSVEAYCWLNHVSMSEFLTGLADDFIKKHPLTAKQRAFYEEHRKKG